MKPILNTLVKIVLPLFLATAFTIASAQEVGDVSSPDDYFLLTVVLKHDQSKNLDQLREELEATGFWAQFPPEGIVVESWYVMMGLGQVVTVRVPPSRLREVSRTIEQTAWGAFRTDIYTTYDISKAAAGFRAQAKENR